MKTCKTCKSNKPLTSFHRQKMASDGFRATCKDCLNANYRSKYKERTPEQVQEAKDYQKQYRKENQEKIRALQRQWKANNPERSKELNKRSRSKPQSKEAARKRVAKWIANNPDRYKEIRSKSNSKIKRELTDGYIKSIICGDYSSGLTFDDVPPELVELWRQQILIQRNIKNKSND
ncbi:MAG: hypothetical protein AAF741_15720 [Bacteroidota bacterium]